MAGATPPALLAPAPSEPARVAQVILRTTDPPYAALAVAVSQRLPGVVVRASTADAFDRARGDAFCYVEVAGVASGSGQPTLTAILPDGRAFVRSFTVDPEDPVRSTAATLANLVAAIEQEAVAPTQLDAALPPEATPSALAPAPDPTPPRPRVEATPPARSPIRESVPAPPTAKFDTGVALVPAALIGLRAPQLSGAAEASALVRTSRGWLAALALRYSGHPGDGASLHRIRIAIAAGYAWRRGRFALAGALGPTLEPWLLAEGGQRTSATRPPGGSAALLYGGHAWVAPALHATPDGSPVRFEIGARLGFSLSALGSGADVRISRPDGSTVFTLGGPELSAGLWSALWF